MLSRRPPLEAGSEGMEIPMLVRATSWDDTPDGRPDKCFYSLGITLRVGLNV